MVQQGFDSLPDLSSCGLHAVSLAAELHVRTADDIATSRRLVEGMADSEC
jgi:hypothetical protein